MKFPKEIMQEIACMRVGESLTDGDKEYKLVQKKHAGEGRWCQYYSIVFEVDGKFYKSKFSIGSTESQDQSPYEYETSEIECCEVSPVEVITIEYRSKPQPIND